MKTKGSLSVNTLNKEQVSNQEEPQFLQLGPWAFSLTMHCGQGIGYYDCPVEVKFLITWTFQLEERVGSRGQGKRIA